jgi:hypothetical protein
MRFRWHSPEHGSTCANLLQCHYSAFGLIIVSLRESVFICSTCRHGVLVRTATSYSGDPGFEARPGFLPNLTKAFVSLLSVSRKIQGWYLKIDNGRLLQHAWSPSHIIWRYITGVFDSVLILYNTVMYIPRALTFSNPAFCPQRVFRIDSGHFTKQH